ncbi:gonadal somatic cell derived factor [Cyclopterus lumpus]|uniref:TGF-beta family profile domain-containing protein n=1 Tax=Cyclopterus lumpus TaxID=8103 RepID=A0A8C2WEW3_CYCLU|nr:gonadal somatic cell derived factor [Cyclopterus lumpus]
MSFTVVVVMMILLGPSAVIAFVLQPSKEEPAASANSLVSHHRCQGESLQSIRKGLLGSLNLPAEPRLPAGGLDGVREQWRTTFSTIAHRAKDTPIPAASGNSVSPNVGNSTSLKCCSTASEIFMKDLGWDNWVIHPASLTIVQCALCHPEGNTGQCPSPHANDQDADSQVPCCEPISQEMVPILYVDEFSNLVISSVQLTRSCGCDPGDLQPPSRE